jgi:hypothetical protein
MMSLPNSTVKLKSFTFQKLSERFLDSLGSIYLTQDKLVVRNASGSATL